MDGLSLSLKITQAGTECFWNLLKYRTRIMCQVLVYTEQAGNLIPYIMQLLLFTHKQKTGLHYDTVSNASKIITNFHSSRPPVSMVVPALLDWVSNMSVSRCYHISANHLLKSPTVYPSVCTQQIPIDWTYSHEILTPQNFTKNKVIIIIILKIYKKWKSSHSVFTKTRHF